MREAQQVRTLFIACAPAREHIEPLPICKPETHHIQRVGKGVFAEPPALGVVDAAAHVRGSDDQCVDMRILPRDRQRVDRRDPVGQ